MESVLTHGGSAQSHTALSSTSISAGVSATSAGSWGAARAIIAVQKQRQAMTEKTAMSLVRRSAIAGLRRKLGRFADLAYKKEKTSAALERFSHRSKQLAREWAMERNVCLG